MSDPTGYDGIAALLHRQIGDDDIFEEMIENAEDGGFTGELLGTMLCTEGARILSKFVGAENAKKLLASLIETLDRTSADDTADRGSLSVH